jgi:hypothetical protein
LFDLWSLPTTRNADPTRSILNFFSFIVGVFSVSESSDLNLQLFLSLAMKRPEKVAGHDVGDDGEQHEKDRNPENPTVMHSTPARSARMTVVILVTMVSIVHRKQGGHITDTSLLGKEKGPSRTGGSEPGWRFDESTPN